MYEVRVHCSVVKMSKTLKNKKETTKHTAIYTPGLLFRIFVNRQNLRIYTNIQNWNFDMLALFLFNICAFTIIRKNTNTFGAFRMEKDERIEIE